MLNNVIYNIGGAGSSHAVMWCRHSPTYAAKWEFMDLSTSGFTGYCGREAFAGENKIVYFGANCENATFVLEQEEDSEQLKVIRKD